MPVGTGWNVGIVVPHLHLVSRITDFFFGKSKQKPLFPGGRAKHEKPVQIRQKGEGLKENFSVK
jgi:hypothetical protein